MYVLQAQTKGVIFGVQNSSSALITEYYIVIRYKTKSNHARAKSNLQKGDLL